MNFTTKALTLLFAILLTFQAQACPAHKSVSAGEPAPCNGHFFNEPTEQSIRKDVRDNQLRKKQLELKDLQLSKLSVDRDNWKVEAKKQAKLRHGKDSDMKKGVIAGVVLTLAVMFAARQVSE